jgi:hypothetical protein
MNTEDELNCGMHITVTDLSDELARGELRG